MNNFERIKEMNIDEFVKLLDQLDEGYCDTPWTTWFNDNYCSKCEPVMAYAEYAEKELKFAWCELSDKCKFFPELNNMPSCEQTIKLWLESECV